MWGTEWIGTYAGWDRLLVAVTELSSAHSADEDSFMREAREAVDRACDVLEETSPEQTLGTAWKFLDQQFRTPQKPSQEILARLGES